MQKRMRNRAGLLAGAIGAGLFLPALASAAESGGGRQVEEVIVTAERREASIQDTSISITAFTGEFLEDFGIRNQEDLQNYIPATTIQPYDATVRGVGRNFRALGGDPGVATYMNGIYSEDLLTATGASFWDVVLGRRSGTSSVSKYCVAHRAPCTVVTQSVARSTFSTRHLRTNSKPQSRRLSAPKARKNTTAPSAVR